MLVELCYRGPFSLSIEVPGGLLFVGKELLTSSSIAVFSEHIVPVPIEISPMDTVSSLLFSCQPHHRSLLLRFD